MNQPNIEVSVEQQIQSTIAAMERVTSAILAGNPAGAATIKGRKTTAQFSFKMRDSGLKNSIKEAAERKLITEVFVKNATKLEAAIRNAVLDIVANMVGHQNKNIQVLGRTLGQLTSRTPLENEPFAKFIKTQKGAGEIGLPDPEGSLENLKLALIAAISVDVVVRRNGPQVKFRFDQRKLLKLTPHPDQFGSGPKGAFYSWLSLITGPDYLSGGTPGYSMVTVGEIRKEMTKASSRKNAGLTSARMGRNLKKIQIMENMTRISRTLNYAGELAAVMLSTDKKGQNRKSSAEFFGGSNKQYKPSKNYSGFWDKWWIQRKLELNTFIRRIMFAAVRALLRG